MAETLTIARPYAEAVFALAREKNRLQPWADMLAFLSSVAEDAQMKAIFNDPKVSDEALVSTVLAIGGERLDEPARNFVHVLARNNRLALLPEIAQLFEQLKDAQEGVLEANIASAFPLDEGQVKDLTARLESKFKKKIEPRVTVDRELIGGVKIEIGDEVWDASVKGKLETMAFALAR